MLDWLVSVTRAHAWLARQLKLRHRVGTLTSTTWAEKSSQQKKKPHRELLGLDEGPAGELYGHIHPSVEGGNHAALDPQEG